MEMRLTSMEGVLERTGTEKLDLESMDTLLNPFAVNGKQDWRVESQDEDEDAGSKEGFPFFFLQKENIIIKFAKVCVLVVN